MKEKECDFCKKQVAEYVDGKTVYGCWANMCMDCFMLKGIGLGTGKGQHYKTYDGKYVKVAG